MLIFIFLNANKPNSFDIASEICTFFISQKITVVSPDSYAQRIGALPLEPKHLKDITFAISLGGDGTILRLINHYPEMQGAILGINLGHLGFMAAIPADKIYDSLKHLIDHDYKIEERVMIKGTDSKGTPYLAANDIVFHRGQNPSLVELEIYIDDNYLNTFQADGIIVSTPTGSTAYSLAAGGPILTPDLDAFVLTPINPHTISNRPIVVSSHETIKVKYLSDYLPIEVRSDGMSLHTMSTGDSFQLTKAERKYRLVNLTNQNFFFTLRSKLNWTGKLR
ncbi:MAG: NAD(+)/NADH kinase [Rhabdochlamydiaceae bacterium]